MKILIGFLLFIILGCIVFGIFTLLKVDKTSKNSEDDHKATLAQEFFPVISFNDNMLELNNYRFRAILEIDSINYLLQNPIQKVDIEKKYQAFLMSLENPITIFRETTTVDLQNYFQYEQNQFEDITQQFPKLTKYANEYLVNLKTINLDSKGLDQHLLRNKRNYIVSGYIPKITKDKTEEEIRQEAFQQLNNQCDIISSNLKDTGVGATRLGTDQLIKLFTSIFHRDSEDFSENIVSIDEFGRINSRYSKLIVDGQNLLAGRRPSEKMYDILDSSRKRLNVEILSRSDLSSNTIEQGREIDQYFKSLEEYLVKSDVDDEDESLKEKEV